MSTRKTSVFAKDIVLALVMGGDRAVINLYNNSGFTAKTMDNAIALVADNNSEHASSLTALRGELFPASTGQRGRRPAQVGDVRSYSVQEVGNTGAFLRLPVELLGLAKGDTAYVTFENGAIVVRAAE